MTIITTLRAIKRHTVKVVSITMALSFMMPSTLLAESANQSTKTMDIRIPLDAELQRFMLATKRFVKEENYSQAARYIEKAMALKIEPPASIFYYKGIVNHNNHLWAKARIDFEEYILRSNKEDQYYSDTLEMITEIENKTPEPLNEKLIQQDITWESTENPANTSTLVNELKRLHMTDSASTALVTHINTLLASAPFTGQRIISSNNTSAATELSISITEDRRITVQKKQNQNNSSQIMSFSTSIFGLSRDFVTQCDSHQHKCSIKHKDTLNTWFEIAYDQTVAKEIAETASALVLTLQTKNQD